MIQRKEIENIYRLKKGGQNTQKKKCKKKRERDKKGGKINFIGGKGLSVDIH